MLQGVLSALGKNKPATSEQSHITSPTEPGVSSPDGTTPPGKAGSSLFAHRKSADSRLMQGKQPSGSGLPSSIKLTGAVDKQANTLPPSSGGMRADNNIPAAYSTTSPLAFPNTDTTPQYKYLVADNAGKEPHDNAAANTSAAVTTLTAGTQHFVFQSTQLFTNTFSIFSLGVSPSPSPLFNRHCAGHLPNRLDFSRNGEPVHSHLRHPGGFPGICTPLPFSRITLHSERYCGRRVNDSKTGFTVIEWNDARHKNLSASSSSFQGRYRGRTNGLRREHVSIDETPATTPLGAENYPKKAIAADDYDGGCTAPGTNTRLNISRNAEHALCLFTTKTSSKPSKTGIVSPGTPGSYNAIVASAWAIIDSPVCGFIPLIG